MRNVIPYLFLLLLALSGVSASAQVIDVSTGISNSTSTMLPIGSIDDTWTVALPGSNISNPASFQTASCGLNNYGGSSPNVRWLYPTGYSNNSAPMGDYYFKTTFDLACGNITAAQFNFAHIGADDIIYEIIVNGYSHPVTYGFASWGVNVTLPLALGELNAGANTILVHTYNWGPSPGSSSPFGLEIEGNLTVTTAPQSAAFTLTSNGSTVQASSTVSGNHTWIVYSSPTGNQGSYSYVGTYNTANLNFQATAPCYFIQHSVTNECGTECAAQSICNLPCKKPCNIAVPVNLKLLYSGPMPQTVPGLYKFSWNAVAGATSYVLEIVWNDPTCCRNGEPVSTVNIPVSTNSYQMDISTKCFSWRVKALCADGIPTTSDKKCETLSSGGGNPSGKPGTGSISDEHPRISIFPNPAHESVSFDIESASEGDVTVVVTDINGRTVKTFDRMKTSGKKANIEWNTASLSKGIYIVKITAAGNQVTTRKLVIE